jgi:chorismate synthase
MDHALLHRAQNADVATKTPKIAGSAKKGSKPKSASAVHHNPEPSEA